MIGEEGSTSLFQPLFRETARLAHSGGESLLEAAGN